MKRFLLLIVLLGLLPAQAQTPEEVRGIVQSELQRILGREFVLMQFTFASNTWNDSSMDCPAEGATYPAEPISGYIWKFLLDDGIRYELHSNLDGSQIIFCPAFSVPEVTYSTYSGQFFTIQHPNLWSVQRITETEYDFAFRGVFDCSLPGMQVFVYPDQAGADTALTTLAGTGGNSLDTLGLSISGKTIVYNSDCNGVNRTWRGTQVNGASGKSYIVLQWSPAITFTIWDKVFVEILGKFQESGASLSTNAQPPIIETATPATAPDPTQVASVPVAPNIDMTTISLVHVFGGDIYVGKTNDLPGLSITYGGAIKRDRLRIAPMTGQLAYVENNARLYVVTNLDLGDHTTVTENIVALPPAWSSDGTKLAYTVASENEGMLLVKARLSDGTHQDMGEIPFNASCAPTTFYDVDYLYWRETGLTLEWLPDGRFIYSTGCNGLSLWNPSDNSITNLGDDLYHAALSPDRAQLAVIGAEGLIVIDLATLQEKVITTQKPPELLAWDVTGTQLFYSASIKQESLILSDEAFRANAESTLGVFPFESRQNSLSISQIDVNSGAETQKWEGVGFAIGRMIPAPNGLGVFFSLIPSDRALLDAFTNNQTLTVVKSRIPETQLWFLPPEGGTAQLMAITAQSVFAIPPHGIDPN